MKTLIIFILSIFLTACGDADKGVLHDSKLLEPNRVYKVDGWGSNPDIYEFTPVGHEHMACLILVRGGDKATEIECFEKKKEEVNK